MSVENITLNRQIVVLLGNNKGLTISQLLTKLQESFPTEGWTEEILQLFLTNGIRRGRYCVNSSTCGGGSCGTGGNGDSIYKIRKDMVIVNPRNWVYQDLSSCIIKRYNTNVQITDNTSQPFNGGESCLLTT